jgi:hypothetical protein
MPAAGVASQTVRANTSALRCMQTVLKAESRPLTALDVPPLLASTSALCRGTVGGQPVTTAQGGVVPYGARDAGHGQPIGGVDGSGTGPGRWGPPCRMAAYMAPRLHRLLRERYGCARCPKPAVRHGSCEERLGEAERPCATADRAAPTGSEDAQACSGQSGPLSRRGGRR